MELVCEAVAIILQVNDISNASMQSEPIVLHEAPSVPAGEAKASHSVADAETREGDGHDVQDDDADGDDWEQVHKSAISSTVDRSASAGTLVFFQL